MAYALAIPQVRAAVRHHLMRILTHSGFSTQQKVEGTSDDEGGEREGYILTPPLQLLLRDNLMSIYPIVVLTLNPVLILDTADQLPKQAVP